MEVTVNRESVREYVARQRDRYRKAGRAEKGRILDETYHRKSAVRLLCSREGKGGRVGRPVDTARRWQPQPGWSIGIHSWESWRRGCRRSVLEMDSETEALLGRASAATFERLLAAAQVPVRKRVTSLTKAGTLLRNRIAVRQGLGRCETGLRRSGHGGALWSDGVPPVDGDGGGRGDGVGGDGRGVGQDAGACGRGDTLQRRLPVPLLGLDSDKFINHGLYAYCEDNGITFTRSRPYRKNAARTSSRRTERWYVG